MYDYRFLENKNKKNETRLSGIPFILILSVLLILPVLSSNSAAEEKNEKKETIVIPVKQYNQLIEKLSSSVLLPINQYRSLLERLERQKQSVKTKEKSAVEHAKYRFKIKDGSVYGTAGIKYNFLVKGWQQIGSNRNSVFAAVDNVKINGKEARFTTHNNYFYVHTADIGKATVEFSFYSTGFSSTKNTKRIGNNLILGLQTDTIVEIDEDDIVIEAKGAIVNSVKRSSGNTTIYLINNDSSFGLFWRKKAKMAEKQVPSKFLASVSSLYQPGTKYQQISHIIAIQMQRGKEDEFVLSFPAECRLLEVVGEGIKAHRTERVDDCEKLIISTLTPVEDNIVLILRMERRTSESNLKIKPPVVENAERQLGFIAIAPTEPAAVTAGESSFFNRIDIRELPPEIGEIAPSEPATAFNYRLRKGEKIQNLILGLRFQPAAEMLASFIKDGKILTLFTEEGKCITRINFNLITASEQFLRLELNKNDTILSAMVGNKPVPAVHENRDLIIPLKNKTTDRSYNIEIVFLTEFPGFREDGDQELILPKTSVPVHLFDWEVYLPEDFIYEDFGGNVFEGKPVFKPSVKQLIQLELSKISSVGEVAADEATPQIAKAKRRIERAEEMRDTLESAGKEAEAPVPPGAQPTTGAAIDLSSSTLSLAIDIPRSGVRKRFYSLMLKNENPRLTFNYEKK